VLFVQLRVCLDLVDQRLQILKLLTRMDVVTHDTVEEIQIEDLILLIRLKH
jgi:hypothetical protein